MRRRWGTCGEELALAVLMAVVFAGWLGMGAEKVIAGGGPGSGFERASYSSPGLSADFSVGSSDASEMTTAGWSVCWRSAGKADGRCLDIEVAWGLAVQANALRAEDLASCVGERCDQLNKKSQ